MSPRGLEDAWNEDLSANSHSLTAILPLISQNLAELPELLSTLTQGPTRPSEVILVCPESLLSRARKVLLEFASTLGSEHHLEFSLHPFPDALSPSQSVIAATAFATTDWVLILDLHGLKGVGADARDVLLNPRSLPALPIGPTGVVSSAVGNFSCIRYADAPQSASFLLPPFASPSTLLQDIITSNLTGVALWAHLGHQLSHSHPEAIGGTVIGTSSSNMAVCIAALQSSGELGERRYGTDATGTSESESSTVFAIVLESPGDLRRFAQVPCALQQGGYSVKILISTSARDATTMEIHESRMKGIQTLNTSHCLLSFQTTPSPTSGVRDIIHIPEWLAALSPKPAVIITTMDEVVFRLVSLQGRFGSPTFVSLPRRDLLYCDWMSSLSFQEWRNWNLPRIDLSIITNDRPGSLARLLSSLKAARYFGDNLQLRINMDQSADDETKRLVSEFSWTHGNIFIHHRVIHGGLLPAVAESWYPHTNDSYGLLLEDDVELSPLFYAWVKMAVLRYRYSSQNESPQLFGVSLYQQKTIELRPEGRVPFNARTLFSRSDLPHHHTPYLSQIPCSWGAVYFPEHWREFHAYLSARLSEALFSVDVDVVPDLRSNRWSNSWKKYFIELVYLRGYVMLYPNFPDFVSLSTNHLEVGSHVKDTPKDVYRRKRELFFLPLLQLSNENEVDENSPTGLLNLPGGSLPPWSLLPVLDLTGCFTSTEEAISKGSERAEQLFGCTSTMSRKDITQVAMCPQGLEKM
ncbi:hypothetical protein JAAARDRAFT_190293 [Jaapia argillacea MUCL 33604]|uniref:Glycosyltransferase family 2 protein n=1 Tax=Jaapia argillacea MUCL 33604 TaxID=933084 RepID=A0A067Q3K0_9AGAM|nr:hypothetical protein JAAARDRAFT_190293 [Jaapia argillacea MUCL 33604]